ncbi:MAG: ADP-ribosylglycohydrolase family protein [Isosphaeraceae bacterium]
MMTAPRPDLSDRFVGCLLGCAVGDALGAPFEGYWDHQLPGRTALLRGYYEVEGYPRGQYTDDTQLTLATVESIVRQGDLDPADVARSIVALWKNGAVVGPGGACSRAAINFLKNPDWTTCGAPVGQAGNGTAMRTAALGLYFLNDPERLPAAVADIARITHQDPRSIAGGVAIAKAAELLTRDELLEPGSFCAQIARAMQAYEPTFAALVADLPANLLEGDETALHAIASAGLSRPEFSRPVISPFVVPTVLACLWSLLKSPDSWANAVTRAIRLGGDVDTLGAIVGALAGARLGAAAIPAHLAAGVLDSERIRVLASRYHAVVTARNARPTS